MSIKSALLFCAALFSSFTLADEYRQFNVMAINDIYNIEGIDAGKSGSMARLRSLRKQLSRPGESVLLLHAGDFLFPSSMSSQYKGEQMIDLMNGLDGDFDGFDEHFFVVFGNHEFDKRRMKDAPVLAKRIEQSGFYWLGTNITLDKAATTAQKDFQKSLIKQKILEISGVKVGIFGITTDIAIPEYAEIDNHYVAIAKANVAELRAKGAEVVIAVTHLPMPEDEALIKALGEQGPDAIFGGHEHARQYFCQKQRCVYKADADARSATIATVGVDGDGKVDISYRFSLIDETTIASDSQVKARTDQWLDRYQREYCAANKQDAGCLSAVIGRTEVKLVAEELEIRRFETNLGAFAADQMIAAFDQVKLPGDKKVQVALLNAGSLRLNQNIPTGTDLNVWYLNGIFQYPVKLRVIEISGKQLRQAVKHSITGWTGNGKFLQISGFAFRHDTANERATDLSLIDRQGKLTPVKDDDTIVAVVNSYIADPNASDQDGYTMLNLDNELVYGELIELKDKVRAFIEQQWRQGKAINPQAPGRVCNSQRPHEKCVLD